MPKHIGREPTVYKQKQKHAIQKQAKQDLKSLRKDAKQKKAMGMQPVKLRKDMGLPNLKIQKQELLDQIERKQRMDQQTREHMTNIQEKRNGLDMAQYLSKVQTQQNQYEEVKKYETQKFLNNDDGMVDTDPNARSMNQSKKAYAKELKKVIEASDVIIEVLDARDPEGCRSHEMEKEILTAGKKYVLDILNARMWQRHLRNEFPCLLFKTNRQNQDNLSMGTALHKNSMLNNSNLVDSMIHTSKAVGTDNLMNILKNYARVEGGNGKTKQQITVGVVGFPNRAAATGNMPGVTKAMQEIQLDKNIILIDSPGVVLSTKDQSDSLILRQAIKIEDITDPFRPVEAIMNRVDNTELLAFYGIPPYKSTDEFLGSIEIFQFMNKIQNSKYWLKGYLKAGGIANFDQTARSVIRDFLNGKLKYFTAPPAMEGEDMDEDGDVEME